jgi:sulfur carrier protein
MRLCVNGDTRDVAEGLTVAELLAALGIDPRGVAVERNKTVVPRSAFSATALAAGDAIEIVRFVGGG